jgi:hypothetical protein
MERVPQVKEVLNYFPWGRLASDDTFSHVSPILPSLFKLDVDMIGRSKDYFLAERNLLGSSGYGYWSSSPIFAPHESSADIMGGQNEIQKALEEIFQNQDSSKKYLSGYMLLGKSHSNEKIGWHGIPDDQIPWFNFSAKHQPPKCIEAGQTLKSWKEWHEWRGISRNSPVALVMFQVMSVYYMLVDALDIKPLGPGEKKTLEIHFLGAEVELNCIPLFGGLSLLLPGYHLEITFFGHSVLKLTSQAEKKHKDSLAGREGPIFEYKAPESLGSGSVAVTLYRDQALWTLGLRNTKTPDVLVALNAGLSAYQNEWDHVISALSMLRAQSILSRYRWS